METLLPAVIGPAVGGAIAFLLLWKVIPDMLTAFREELAAERKQHGEHIDKLLVRLEVVEQGISTIQMTLHDRAAWATRKVAPGEPVQVGLRAGPPAGEGTTP